MHPNVQIEALFTIAAGHPWGSHARRQTLGVEGTASLEEDASQAFYREEKSMPGF